MPRDLFRDQPIESGPKAPLPADAREIELLYAGHTPEFFTVRVIANRSNWKRLKRELVNSHEVLARDKLRVTMSEAVAREAGLL